MTSTLEERIGAEPAQDEVRITSDGLQEIGLGAMMLGWALMGVLANRYGGSFLSGKWPLSGVVLWAAAVAGAMHILRRVIPERIGGKRQRSDATQPTKFVALFIAGATAAAALIAMRQAFPVMSLVALFGLANIFLCAALTCMERKWKRIVIGAMAAAAVTAALSIDDYTGLASAQMPAFGAIWLMAGLCAFGNAMRKSAAVPTRPSV